MRVSRDSVFLDWIKNTDVTAGLTHGTSVHARTCYGGRGGLWSLHALSRVQEATTIGDLHENAVGRDTSTGLTKVKTNREGNQIRRNYALSAMK